VGTPEEILNEPDNTFMAGFVEEHAMNFLDVGIRAENGESSIAHAGCRMADLTGKLNPAIRRALPLPLQAGIHPHHIEYSETRTRATDVAAEVYTYESLGERGVLRVHVHSQEVAILTPPHQPFRKAQPLWIHYPLEPMHFFSTETKKRQNVYGPSFISET
jgi:ABC-type sugar transport system ATPase subunit